MPIIEISSLTHPGVDVFCMLTEAQLRQRMEPGKEENDFRQASTKGPDRQYNQTS